MTAKRFQIDDDGDITEFGTNGKWIDCWQYANGKHWESLCDKLNQLNDENEQLKERNNRQAKQLDNLYTLIEKQDWTTLKGLIQEFQECEEQLQKEWANYGDVE